MRRLILSDFLRAGFTFEKAGTLEGWLSRDPFSDDWILWSEKTKQMYRRHEAGRRWQPTQESRRDCLKLGRVYAEMMSIK